MDKQNYDFCGWATRNNLRCSDGRTIMRDAFKDCDGKTVPMVWGHRHDDPNDVLGHMLLENREEGVYGYGFFNTTEKGKNAKSLVAHGDVTSLSIYANKLRQNGGNVVHGVIREVSLVLAGANPGAQIESVLCHGENGDEVEEMIINYDEQGLELAHADEETKEPAAGDKTVKDVIDSMNDEQKKVLYALVAQALEEKNDSKEDETVKHNVFETENEEKNEVLSHDDMVAIIADGKRYGSLRESALAHGITDIEYLFPEAKMVGNKPDFIAREMGWVTKVMNGVHHNPFSRLKSMFADITEDEARAKGYIKGKLKKEEVFSLLKRTTTPQTIYKKQKLDRDDVIDITDFDVVSWLKGEMRMMLDEEIARAILIGDGRLASDDDHIDPTHIRPIAMDDALYTIQETVVPADATDEALAKAIIKHAVKAKVNYKGSGNTTFFTTEEQLINIMLLEDGFGHRLYKTEAEVAQAMRCSNIVTVPVMEGAKAKDTTSDLLGVIVNLNDYSVGADKGGAVSMFEDFDIDYNAQKYLIETRCSGALTKPYSAIALVK